MPRAAARLLCVHRGWFDSRPVARTGYIRRPGACRCPTRGLTAQQAAAEAGQRWRISSPGKRIPRSRFPARRSSSVQPWDRNFRRTWPRCPPPGFEPFVPAIFLGIERAMAVHDPPHVPRPRQSQDERKRRAQARRLEQLFNGSHRAHEGFLLREGKPVQQGCDFPIGPGLERPEYP